MVTNIGFVLLLLLSVAAAPFAVMPDASEAAGAPVVLAQMELAYNDPNVWGSVDFRPFTVLATEVQQKAIEKVLRRDCADLMDVHTRAIFEERFTISIYRGNSNSSAVRYITQFSFETNEGSRFGGEVVVESEADSAGAPLRNLRVISDTSHICQVQSN